MTVSLTRFHVFCYFAKLIVKLATRIKGYTVGTYTESIATDGWRCHDSLHGRSFLHSWCGGQLTNLEVHPINFVLPFVRFSGFLALK